MSNGVPEPFEDRTGRPLPLPVRFAIAYVVLWAGLQLADFLIDIPLFSGMGWAFYFSILLFVISVVVIVKR